MSILILCSHFPPKESPESAHAMFLCEKLAQQGHSVSLITSQLQHGAPQPQGYSIYPVMKNWGWGELPILLSTILSIRPNSILLIYIDWIYGCNPMITFLPSILKIIYRKATFVTQFENISGLTSIQPLKNWRANFYLKLAKFLFNCPSGNDSYGNLLRHSKKIIALSARHSDVFVKIEPSCEKKIRLVPAPPIMRLADGSSDGSARNQGRNMLGFDEKQMLISYFGYLYPMKGVETLLESLQYLSEDVKVLIIGGTGDGAYLEKLKRICLQNGTANMVSWLGHCKPEDDLASKYLYASDICALPFDDGVRLNNSSFAVAASHSLPIVTTRGEKLDSPFINDNNVKLCPPKNPKNLAAVIYELINDCHLRQKLAIGSKRLANEYFSWDSVIDSTLECLNPTMK